MAAPAGADDERADPVDRGEPLVVVVVARQHDVGAGAGERAPERGHRLVGAVQAGAEARVVPVAERAAGRVAREVGGEPALLRRPVLAAAGRAAVRVEDDDVPGAELVGVVAALRQPEVRLGRAVRPSSRTRGCRAPRGCGRGSGATSSSRGTRPPFPLRRRCLRARRPFPVCAPRARPCARPRTSGRRRCRRPRRACASVRARAATARWRRLRRGSSGDALRRQEQLRDLDRVQRCALAQVVAGEEEREAVLDRRVLADPADEHVVAARGAARRRELLERDPGAPPRIEVACSAESGSRVSSQTASAWPTRTGTRTHVALTGSAGSSRILRVSSRSFSSSSNSTPSKLQSIRRSSSSGDCAAQPLHRLRAGARDRLVGGDADAHEPGRVVQRLQRAGERDRAAVRVRDDAVVLGARGCRSPPGRRAARRARAGRRPTCRSRSRRRGRRAGRARGWRRCRRRRGRGRGRRRRAPPASPPRRSSRRARLPAERADAKRRTSS